MRTFFSAGTFSADPYLGVSVGALEEWRMPVRPDGGAAGEKSTGSLLFTLALPTELAEEGGRELEADPPQPKMFAPLLASALRWRLRVMAAWAGVGQVA